MDPSVFSHPSKHHSHQFRFEYVSRMCLPASMPIKIYPINTMLDPSNGQQTALVTNVSKVSLDTHLMVHGVAAQCCPEKCPCWCLGMVLNFLAIWSALEGKKQSVLSGMFCSCPCSISPVAAVAQTSAAPVLTCVVMAVVVETKLEDGSRVIQSPMKFRASVSQQAFGGSVWVLVLVVMFPILC